MFFSRLGALIWKQQQQMYIGKVGAVSFTMLLLRQLWPAICHTNKSKRLHKQHYYDKNAVSWTCVVDSVCDKGRRRVVLHFGEQLQTSAQMCNYDIWILSVAQIFIQQSHEACSKWTHVHFRAHLSPRLVTPLIWTLLYLIKTSIRQCHLSCNLVVLMIWKDSLKVQELSLIHIWRCRRWP